MTNVGFLILFGLSSVLFPCEGQVYPPSNQSVIVVLPGSTEILKWSFVGNPARASLAWYFTRREKPTVTLSCSSPIKVDEGDNVTCVCRGEGGNPPANVIWYKDGVLIGRTGKEEQTLTLRNVNGTDTGTYKCVAQSHTLTDEEYIKIIVYYAVPPRVISLTSTPENVVLGEPVVIMCEATAVPLPSYTIIHNDTEVVSTHNTHIITVLKYSDAGSYKCIATSILGNSSKTFSLSITVTPTTTTLTTKDFGTGKAALEKCNRSGTVWYMVVVLLVFGIIIGILLCYIVLCFRRKFRSRKPQSNPEPKATEVDTTYQELDLSKMNTEDNYQSLRVNAASNYEDSTYTELNTARDVENNYQSLT
ncbi:hemicentin-1 isoform X1 [Paramuricea clavata]|uniref:Hemicentin-1 isoform X1 n=1 Tax=Paramuricea clavata TaxID=317549 RepID=A0A6S7ISZ2_PARCT|nr:hemicentin-1 isoform X1 [Paramuricea clavata]